jgi:2,4-dienoyl-CoA reductase (NADPH2)
LTYPLTQPLRSSQLKGFDKVIIATGVSPRTPPIPGVDHPKVLSYIDVLRHKVPVGKNVAVIGAGGIGFDVSEFLTFHGEMKTKADDVNVDEYLEEWGVDKKNETRSGMIEVSVGGGGVGGGISGLEELLRGSMMGGF